MVLSNNTAFFYHFLQVKFRYILALDPLDRSAPIFTLLVLPKIQCLMHHTVLELRKILLYNYFLHDTPPLLYVTLKPKDYIYDMMSLKKT
jgi:hypothetical protein